MKLDVNTWEYFRLGDIFDIKKGKRLTSEDQTDGNTPYIGAIDSNNGIANYIGQEPIHSGNTISLSYNGSVGEAFYQPEPFWATDDVNVLYFRDENSVTFNEYIALFVCTILKQEKYKYSYGRKWVLDNMCSTVIKLPVKNGCPDWGFMEDYIKSLHCRPLTTKIKASDNRLDILGWKDFYLHKLFNASMGNGIDAVVTTSYNPKYNYITRNSSDNGVADCVDEIDGIEPFPAGTMTLSLGGSLGLCFVQDKPFYTAQNVGILKEKAPLSYYTKLFIATLIRNECRIKYVAFGRELNAHFRKDFTIKLPIKHDGKKAVIDETKEFSDEGYVPDWEWMEEYIKSLPYSDRIVQG